MLDRIIDVEEINGRTAIEKVMTVMSVSDYKFSNEELSYLTNLSISSVKKARAAITKMGLA